MRADSERVQDVKLTDALDALSPSDQLRALLIPCRGALRVWIAGRPDELRYYDGVVGAPHAMDMQLPERAVLAIAHAIDTGDRSGLAAIDEAYTEPIVALQNDDVSLESPLEAAYYAIYNLGRLMLGRGTDPLVVLSQALESHGVTPEIVAREALSWRRSVQAMTRGPLVQGAFRVVGVRDELLFHDFARLEDAILYANDLAWEGTLAVVFDHLFTPIHQGSIRNP